MKSLLFICSVVGMVFLTLTPIQTHPHDNTFWQFANWTAKQHTNESCYVCHILPSSVLGMSLRPTPDQNQISMLKALGLKCINPEFCLNGTKQAGWQNLTHYENIPPSKWCKKPDNNCSDAADTVYPAYINHLKGLYKDRRPVSFRAFLPPRFRFSMCFRGLGNLPMGNISVEHCIIIYDPYLTNLTCRANCSVLHPGKQSTVPNLSYKDSVDWYWVCGKHVYLFLPQNWGGVCALTQFNSSVVLVTKNPYKNTHVHRSKRSTGTDDSFPPPEHYIISRWTQFWYSAIPHYGVTKAWDQIEITHYRLATFVNATNAAMEGIKIELTALRLTTVQNRMALDILLAKEGGVCAIVGDTCCTFVPANDEDQGVIGTEIDKMNRIAAQLNLDEQSKSGWGWSLFHSLFGFLTPYVAMIIPILVVLFFLCTFGPCIFRCILNRVYAMVTAFQEPRYIPLRHTEDASYAAE